MNEHQINMPQRPNTSSVVEKESLLLNHRETTLLEAGAFRQWQIDTKTGVFDEPRSGYDFSGVPTLTGMALRNRPLLRAWPMVQRSPLNEEDSGSASCPNCPESTDQNSEVSSPVSEASESAQETASSPGESQPVEESAAPVETPADTLIVDNSAEELGPGQMKKGEFLVQLRAEVCRVVDVALAGVGRDTEGCPYLDYWFDFYSVKDGAHIERAIRRYAPETASVTNAEEYIPIIAERAGRAAEVWARTGELTGVPEGVPTNLPGEPPPTNSGEAPASTGTVMAKARNGGARKSEDPQAIQAELGEGQSLDSGVRSRMESAFGVDFSHVRAHTDSGAAKLSNNLNARAFTVGKHVAFGGGEYKPGTLAGDALIAHELAHVVQQWGQSNSDTPGEVVGETDYSALEADADKSALSILTSLWSGAKQTVYDLAENVRPSLRSGLKLQRCDSCNRSTPPPQASSTTTGPTSTTVTFTLQNQTASGADPSVSATPIMARGMQVIRLTGIAPANYTPTVTISAPDNSTASQYEAGLIQNVLTTNREFSYTPAVAVVRTTLPTVPIKDGAPRRSGIFDDVFAENGGGHPGVLERFTTNGGSVNLSLPDTPGDAAAVNLSDEPSCAAGLASATLSRLFIHDTFRTWVGTRNRTTGAVTTHHHIDWETNWDVAVTVTNGTPSATINRGSINVTEPNGNGSPSYVSGPPVPAEVVRRQCNPVASTP